MTHLGFSQSSKSRSSPKDLILWQWSPFRNAKENFGRRECAQCLTGASGSSMTGSLSLTLLFNWSGDTMANILEVCIPPLIIFVADSYQLSQKRIGYKTRNYAASMEYLLLPSEARPAKKPRHTSFTPSSGGAQGLREPTRRSQQNRMPAHQYA